MIIGVIAQSITLLLSDRSLVFGPQTNFDSSDLCLYTAFWIQKRGRIHSFFLLLFLFLIEMKSVIEFKLSSLATLHKKQKNKRNHLIQHSHPSIMHYERTNLIFFCGNAHLVMFNVIACLGSDWVMNLKPWNIWSLPMWTFHSSCSVYIKFQHCRQHADISEQWERWKVFA